jgi:hypothetical protein
LSWGTVPLPVDEDFETISPDDFTRGQAWYDLTIAVHPTNANEVLVGGIDLFKTADGGATWNQLSKWWDGVPTTAPVVHADQHEILYRPGFPGEAIFGNDGGVYYGSNLSAGTSSAEILARNKNYNVTQFYSAALHPVLPNYMLGGTQDNGTLKFTNAGFGSATEANGGDGAMCFIDQLDPSLQIVSYVYNDISISKNGGASFHQLMSDFESGHFINIGEYDPHRKMLYTARDASSLYRIKVSNTNPNEQLVNIPGLGSLATAMRVSPFTTSQSNLYVGTQAGRIFKIANAEVTTPVITELTSNALPTGSISSIAFGASEDQILITFFNYGIESIWETRNGGDTWQNKEGIDFPNMPVRWAEYHPLNPDQAYVATELGVWSTDNINVANPVWKSTNGGLANVRTDMLQIRKSDRMIMASTHGRGVFTALIPSQLEQLITFDPLADKTYKDDPFTISASSTSSLPVTFKSSDPGIASVSGNTITINGAGTVSITAEQDGNVQYNPAEPVSQTLIINKAEQTISFATLTNRTVNENSFELTAESSAGLAITYISSDTDIATITGSTVSLSGNTGTTIITAMQAGNVNYLPAPDITQSLTVISRVINLAGDLDFGEVIIGEQGTRELTVSNTGTALIKIDEILFPEGYTIDSQENGNTTIVTITFTPTEPKEYKGIIEVKSDATSGLNTVGISGTGIMITDAEKLASKNLSLYPNPTNEWVTITGGNFQHIKSVRITDEVGKSFDEPVQSSEYEMKIKVSSFQNGIYIIVVPLGKKIYYKKFTKN